jgi:hypothetical protein
MKARTVFIIVALMLILTIAPGSAGAGATWKECTGTEQNQEVLDHGIWVVRGATVHGRGMLSTWDEFSSCPELGGRTTTTMNANWDLNGIGPMWGTGHSETTDGGVWEGTWQGAISPDGICTYKAVSHGISGSVKGLTLFLTANCTNPVTTFTATILDPGGE